MKIPFNIPPYVGTEEKYITQAISDHKICGDGKFTAKCSGYLKDLTSASKILLTTSCTHALEMAAILCGIGPGDEVIMPSFTFVSTADAFVLRGAKAVFVDIRPDTLNIDETKIEAAITKKTKAIVPVHYAGVACEMDTIMDIAKRHGLYVIEDAAQAIDSYYNGRHLGTIGDFGCFSFHETKNISMGEGGAIAINNPDRILDAEIIREKGTNRSQFFRGQVDKYTWIKPGSSYLPSELNAAYLWAQLCELDKIQKDRIRSWNIYLKLLKPLEDKGYIKLPVIPEYATNNAHMFYIKTADIDERQRLIEYLKEDEIVAVFHYIPLHTSDAGKLYAEFVGSDDNTMRESERLLRLPMYYGLREEDIKRVVEKIIEFYTK